MGRCRLQKKAIAAAECMCAMFAEAIMHDLVRREDDSITLLWFAFDRLALRWLREMEQNKYRHKKPRLQRERETPIKICSLSLLHEIGTKCFATTECV